MKSGTHESEVMYEPLKGVRDWESYITTRTPTYLQMVSDTLMR